jgi:cephalosporin hydroxylase
MAAKYGDRTQPKSLVAVRELVDSVNRQLDIDIPGLTSIRVQKLLNGLASQSSTYLEIGSYAGGSASLVASNEKVKNVYSVDLGTPINKEIPIKNVNNFKNKNCEYLYFQGSSFDQNTIDVVKTTVGKVDILFIDGDHSYNGVLNDFKNYSDMVKNGGYIVFDDYMDNIYSPEVNGAVDYIISNLLDNNYEIIGSLVYPELTLTNIVKTSSNEFIIRKLLSV